MKCSQCGAELKTTGILCETSLLVDWNEEREAFLLDINSLSLKDFEIKCPECYSLGIDIDIERE